MGKIKYFLLGFVFFLSLPLASCGNSKKYTVTWKNYDGTILEVDEGVDKDELPSYDGDTPLKPSSEQYTYTFSGWSPEIEPVKSDVVYTANFTSETNEYLVTWDIEGQKTTEIYKYGAIPSFKQGTPSKESTAQYSYSFTGWEPSISRVTNDITYTAQFKDNLNKYKIIWDVDGTRISETYEYGQIPSYKEGTPKKNSSSQYSYAFTGWYPSIQPVSENATYTAQFDSTLTKAKIEFNLDGGTTSSSTSARYASSISSSSFFFDVKKTNYNFRGWSYEGNRVFDEKKKQYFTPAIEEVMIFTAIYSQDASLTITTNMPEAGTVSGEGYYPYNSFVDVSVQTNIGYSFVGWYYNGTLLSNQEIYKHMMWSDDVVLEARFKLASYTLDVSSHQSLYGKISIQGNSSYYDHLTNSVEYRSPVTVSAYTATEERRFLGWFNEKGELVETNAVYSFTMPHSNLTLIAKWDADSFDLTVSTNNVNAGSISGAGNYQYGDEVILKAEPFDGYSFNRWTVNGSSYYKPTINIYMPNRAVEAIAYFNVDSYTITYDLNGGNNNGSNPYSYNVETEIDLRDASRTGYTFAGWEDSNGNIISKISKGTTGNITLKAIWNVDYYNVTANVSNPKSGTIIGAGTYAYGTQVTLEAIPNEGYAFDYLYNNTSNGRLRTNPYSFELYYDHDFDFTAYFKLINYSITYNLNGGTNSTLNPVSYTVEDTITFEAPSKIGYTFAGWRNSSGDYQNTISAGTTGNITLDAVWTVNSYTVALTSSDVSKGSVSGGGTFDFNSTVTVTATSNSNCVFKGWYSDSSYETIVSDKAVYSFTLGNGNVALFAKFLTKAEDDAWKESLRLGTEIPTITEDGHISYGMYPQTCVDNPFILSVLNNLDPSTCNECGYYLYNDEYYYKMDSANPDSKNYTFDNGDIIEKGKVYWFKVEPIKWTVLTDKNGSYFLAADLILAKHSYGNTSSSGPLSYLYKNSTVRKWLNNEFLSQAFFLNNEHVLTTDVISKNYYQDPYVSYVQLIDDHTSDKVFILSEDELTNYSESVSSRMCKTTDFARASGVSCSTKEDYYNCGEYLTRSPGTLWSSNSVRGVKYVNYDGKINDGVTTTCDWMGVRPAIWISLA